VILEKFHVTVFDSLQEYCFKHRALSTLLYVVYRPTRRFGTYLCPGLQMIGCQYTGCFVIDRIFEIYGEIWDRNRNLCLLTIRLRRWSICVPLTQITGRGGLTDIQIDAVVGANMCVSCPLEVKVKRIRGLRGVTG
jgi:hypothetical protein